MLHVGSSIAIMSGSKHDGWSQTRDGWQKWRRHTVGPSQRERVSSVVVIHVPRQQTAARFFTAIPEPREACRINYALRSYNIENPMLCNFLTYAGTSILPSHNHFSSLPRSCGPNLNDVQLATVVEKDFIPIGVTVQSCQQIVDFESKSFPGVVDHDSWIYSTLFKTRGWVSVPE